MIPKQTEMDGIVKQIFKAIETEGHLQSTILVLCGDHGMNEAGNHGGSAEGETSPALLFLSPKLQNISKGSDCPLVVPESSLSYYSTVEQSDIVPTLAGLLGFPVPLNNLGVFIPELLAFWDEGEPDRGKSLLGVVANGFIDVRVDLMRQNARQILDVICGAFPELSFDGIRDVKDCASLQSDSEKLDCLWSRATRSLDPRSRVDSAQSLRALTEV